MPLYEYRCTECGDVFEVLQKVTDEPLKVHKNCGGPVERLLSPPALQFKGAGWYVTDYARGSSGSTTSGNDGKETPKSPPKAETVTSKSSADSK